MAAKENVNIDITQLNGVANAEVRFATCTKDSLVCAVRPKKFRKMRSTGKRSQHRGVQLSERRDHVAEQRHRSEQLYFVTPTSDNSTTRPSGRH